MGSETQKALQPFFAEALAKIILSFMVYPVELMERNTRDKRILQDTRLFGIIYTILYKGWMAKI